MLWSKKSLCARIALSFNKVIFHLFFKRRPDGEDYCNSKVISLLEKPSIEHVSKSYLAFIRCDTRPALIDDGSERNFDIALNLYANRSRAVSTGYDYLIAGGINKYKAAYQFFDHELLRMYEGFIFLDDDLEMTYSDLCGFFNYCNEHKLHLTQPSLTRDSYYSHAHLVNASDTGWRYVDMIEVMCPYFSADALKSAISTFDLSYSTWGLDYIWPRLPGIKPVVVDEFTIRHTRPVDANSAFYRYMRKIGISPECEARKLKNMPLSKLKSKGIEVEQS